MRVAGFEKESVVDGPGIRFVVFFQGCPHHCEGCHNPNTLDPQGGEEYSLETIQDEISFAKDKGITGVTFSGGEPFLQRSGLAKLVEFVKNLGLHIIIYTGYTYQQLRTMSEKDSCLDEILQNTDLLIDGPFIKAERDLNLAFRGSRNQRIIDIPATLRNGQVVMKDF